MTHLNQEADQRHAPAQYRIVQSRSQVLLGFGHSVDVSSIIQKNLDGFDALFSVATGAHYWGEAISAVGVWVSAVAQLKLGLDWNLL